MYQIDNSTAAVSQPASTAAGTAGFFTDGNPATSTPATILPAEFLNSVMMELINVVNAGGVTPTKNQFNNVLSAIKRIGQNTVILADTGAANAYTATNSPALVAGTWVNGVVQAVNIAHANTGASTYAPDGLTAIPIYGLGLQPLQGGELFVGGTAILMKATIAGVNSGNPIAVLMECAGGAQQVAAGTQNNHAVNLGQFASSQVNNGYQKLPNGLIVQFGFYTCAAANTAYAASFPIAFPNACFGMVGAMGNTANASTSAVNIGFLNTTQYRVVCASADVVHWIAIGN